VSPTYLGHVSASSISPCGDRSCSPKAGHSRGEICDRLHWVENFRRLEYISTVDSKRHMSKDRRLWVKSLQEKVQEESFETFEARRGEAIHSR
jgi:hypothetical protein